MRAERQRKSNKSRSEGTKKQLEIKAEADKTVVVELAMARRNWSASPPEKPAATMASSITCSWTMGTPIVRSSTLRTASFE